VTLYDVLGVAPDASASTIRAAYRRAAREHHPDRAGEQSSARMAAINAAWQVLGDPTRRAEYDLGMREHVFAPFTPTSASDPANVSAEPAYNPLARYQDPPRIPWRFMGVMAVLGSLVVILGLATVSAPKPLKVDNILHPGDCVAIQPNGDAAERLCTEPHDGVVTLFLTTDARCPDGAEPHRDQQGLGTACIRLG
jgi:molecular chaperone DnaJ